MKGTMRLLVAAAAPLIALWGCDYARMSDQESTDTYEAAMPEMPEGTIPVAGGSLVLREADPSTLQNPAPPSPESVESGAQRYGFYCVFCHGERGDGHGPVGESFFALPADLRDEKVQAKSDGELFKIISFGRGRMPALASTAAERDLWLIIHYLRSLAGETEPGNQAPP